MDELTHGEMTQIILQQKQVTKDLEELEISLNKWNPKLEDVSGKLREITKIFKKVRDKYTEIKGVVEELDAKKSKLQAKFDALDMDKEMLRNEAKSAKNVERTVDADLMLEQFKDMGINPEQHELEENQQAVDAEDALASLKAQMDLD